MEENLAETIAQKINALLKKEKETSEFLRQFGLAKKVQTRNVNTRFACIDGGVAKYSYYLLDIIFLKSAGLVYDIKEGKVENIKQYPEVIRSDIIAVTTGLDDIELGVYTNLYRQLKEVETAIDIANSEAINFLAMDGSIIPHYSYVPFSSPLVSGLFQKLIERYRELFSICKNKNIVLFGLVKASRGQRFCQVIMEKHGIHLESKRDLSLLNFMLQKGERTLIFDYSNNPTQHPILKHFPEYPIKSFYIKNAEHDFPIRVDFLALQDEEKEAGEISNLILHFTIDNSNNIPIFMLEIDKRVRLANQEAETLNSEILGKLDVMLLNIFKRWI